MFSRHRCITKNHQRSVVDPTLYQAVYNNVMQSAFYDGIVHGRKQVMGNKIEVTKTIYQPSFTIPMKRNIFGLYSIRVDVNHIPCTFIIDTGAQMSGIRSDIAKKLQIRKTDGSLAVGSIGGTQKKMAGLCADSLQVGAIAFHPLPMIALGEHDFSLRFAGQELLGFDGILGWDVLSQFDFEMDDIEHSFKGINNCYRFDHPNMIMGSFPVFLVHQEKSNMAIFGFDSGSKTSWIGKEAIHTYNYATLGEVKGMGFGVHGMESMHITIVEDVQYYVDRSSIRLQKTMSGRCDIFPHFTFDGVFGNEIFRDRRIRLVNSQATVLIT